MKQIQYNRTHATRLLPLLGAIGREIQERAEALEALEAKIEEWTGQPDRSEDARSAVAEAAAHRRGLRLAKAELERLGCSVLGTEPLTFRIPGRVGEATQSFVWQTGDPVLK